MSGEEFFDLDFGIDVSAAESHIAATYAPYIEDMVSEKIHLLKLHASTHFLGLENTGAHTEVLRRLQVAQANIDRGFHSLWN